MARRSLSIETLPALAIAEGATTPNPGNPGAWAWSTTLNRPVHWNGSAWSVNQLITVSSTAPASPYTNQLWLDTST